MTTTAITERPALTETISGLIERVTFFNEESGFCVLRVRVGGHREDVTIVGSLPAVTAGEWLVAEGWWVRDREHGLQFKGITLKSVPPTSVEGIERYLRSGFVKGVGPVLAKKLVERFGAEVLNIIEHRAAELESVDGIGAIRRERITEAWQDGKRIREIMLFLHANGVSTSRAVRISQGNIDIFLRQEICDFWVRSFPYPEVTLSALPQSQRERCIQRLEMACFLDFP